MRIYNARVIRTKVNSFWESIGTRDELRQVIRTFKQSSKIESAAEAATLDKILLRISQAILTFIDNRPNDSFSETDEQNLDCLIKIHLLDLRIEIWDTNSNDDKERVLNNTALRRTVLFRRLALGIVSPNKLRWTIKTFCIFKTPISDDIYHVFLRRTGETVGRPLTRIPSVSDTWSQTQTL